MEEIIKVEVGLYATNCYILKDNKKIIIIDPGKKAEKISSYIYNDETVEAIILTHGHFDHIGAVDDLVKTYNCDVYINEKDKELLNHRLNEMAGYSSKVSSDVKNLKEGKVTINGFLLNIIYTPGHTEGSVLIQYKNHLFTGDTLFKQSIGRTDLFGSNNSKMIQSIKLIKTLDSSLIVYPGHGETTILSEELKFNPFLQ